MTGLTTDKQRIEALEMQVAALEAVTSRLIDRAVASEGAERAGRRPPETDARLRERVAIEQRLRVVSHAIGSELPLTFGYHDADGNASRRTVSPYEVHGLPRKVLGWDHDRGAMRDFRLDRMSAQPAPAHGVAYRPAIEPAAELPAPRVERHVG